MNKSEQLVEPDGVVSFAKSYALEVDRLKNKHCKTPEERIAWDTYWLDVIKELVKIQNARFNEQR